MNINMKNWKLGKMFSSGQQAKDFSDVENMNSKIKEVGGLLHFNIHTDKDGWGAQCKEFDGIITGGTSTEPSDGEIQKNIREAIHTAFNVSIGKQKDEVTVHDASDVQALYTRENNTKLAGCAA